jgi:hypothetical protein
MLHFLYEAQLQKAYSLVACFWIGYRGLGLFFKGSPALYWIEAGLTVGEIPASCRPPLGVDFSVDGLITIQL